MPGQRPQALAGFRVPDLERLIVRRSHELAAVRAEADLHDGSAMRLELAEQLHAGGAFLGLQLAAGCLCTG
jgi:hypothetical protein